jgi:hypothetical protein
VHFPQRGKWICQLAEVTGNQRSGYIALWLRGICVFRRGAGFAAKLAALNGGGWRSASVLKVHFQDRYQLTYHHFPGKSSPPEKPLRASLSIQRLRDAQDLVLNIYPHMGGINGIDTPLSRKARFARSDW